MKRTLNSCNAKYLSVNGKANNDKEVAKGSYHYANLVRIKIKIIFSYFTAMETAMSTVRNMPKGAGQQEGPQS